MADQQDPPIALPPRTTSPRTQALRAQLSMHATETAIALDTETAIAPDKSPNPQITKSANLQVSKSPSLQISKSPNLQIRKSPSLQISKSPNLQVAGYKPQLDGLRAVAVLVVAWSHWERPYQFGIPFAAGVHLFHVLSGFLITGILLRVRDEADRGAALWVFYPRRSLRILPAFYLTLLLAWLADVPLVRASVTWHLTYLSNVFTFFRGEWRDDQPFLVAGSGGAVLPGVAE